jgi:hypothetical protein
MKHKRIPLLLLNSFLLSLLSACTCLVQAFLPQIIHGRRHAVVHRLPVSSDNFDEPQVVESSTTTNSEDDEEERAFLEKCRALCKERNLPLEKIKNCRDLASVSFLSKIQPVRDIMNFSYSTVLTVHQ